MVNVPEFRTLYSICSQIKWGLAKLEFTKCFGKQWLSGRVLVSRPRGCGVESHQCHCIVYLKETHLSLLSTSSTKEDPTQHN